MPTTNSDFSQDCVRCFRRAYESFRHSSDDLCIAKAASRISRAYLHPLFVSVALLGQPLAEVACAPGWTSPSILVNPVTTESSTAASTPREGVPKPTVDESEIEERKIGPAAAAVENTATPRSTHTVLSSAPLLHQLSGSTSTASSGLLAGEAASVPSSPAHSRERIPTLGDGTSISNPVSYGSASCVSSAKSTGRRGTGAFGAGGISLGDVSNAATVALDILLETGQPLPLLHAYMNMAELKQLQVASLAQCETCCTLTLHR
jgi:hypothetical protein